MPHVDPMQLSVPFGAVGIIGMATISIALLFVHEPVRFRRMMVGGAVMVAVAVVAVVWLIGATYPDRIG